jgi:hypothetical protein
MPDRSAADLDETCHKLFPGYVPSPLNTSGPPSSEVLLPTRLPAIPATSHLAIRPDYAAPSGTANANADQPGQTANRATESRLGLNSESAGRCYLDIPSERMPEPILRRRQEDLRRSAPGSDGGFIRQAHGPAPARWRTRRKEPRTRQWCRSRGCFRFGTIPQRVRRAPG